MPKKIKLLKLTEQQRVKVYKETLRLFRAFDGRDGICYCLARACVNMEYDDLVYDVDVYNKMKKNYPELHTFKPRATSNSSYWFAFDTEGTNKRLRILRALAHGQSNSPEFKEREKNIRNAELKKLHTQILK